MQEIKRINFLAAHPGVPVPDVIPLAPDRARELRVRLAARLRVSAEDGLTMVRMLSSRSVPVAGINVTETGFRFDRLLWQVQIRPTPRVYLNWYRFDEIDEIEVDAFSEYFDDLWYPSSDDLDVFDESCDWVISIQHSGAVALARLYEPRTPSRASS